MPSTSHKPHPIFRFLLTFAIVYLLTTTLLRLVFPERFQQTEQKEPVPLELTAAKKNAPIGRNVSVTLQNRMMTGVTLQNRCPEPPLFIERIDPANPTLLEQIEIGEPVFPCTPLLLIPGESKVTIDLSPWKAKAFAEAGTYRISLPPESIPEGIAEETVSTEIAITEPGIFVSLFRTFISKPLLNGLILIASLIPNHSLGWSIILLTLLVRTILFFPSQHALEGQKKLQAIQPKIEELKKKHANDQQKVTKETMELWKREKVNPFQSCLPTILQIPILLGLFFIIRDSGHLELAQHLLYAPFRDLPWHFQTTFLGFLSLSYIPFQEITTWFPTPATLKILALNGFLPLSIASLQFGQMWMTFAKKKQKNAASKPLAERMDPQTMMLFMLPVMLFFIAGSLPAAVSLYWGASTLFSIGQQMIVNRKHG